jgi:threonine synthase
VAAEAYARLPAVERAQRRWLLVASAHPAKFREIIEPLVGAALPMPENLARLFARPTRYTEIDANLAMLKRSL